MTRLKSNNSNFRFQVYYSKEYKLYDLTIFSNNEFYGHYHIKTKKDINWLVNDTLKQLKK